MPFTKMADNQNEKLPLTLLTNLSAEQLSLFCHSLVDGWCQNGRKALYDSFAQIWSLMEWWQVIESCQMFIRTAISMNWTKDEIMQNSASLPEQHQQTLCDVIGTRRTDVQKYLINKTNDINCSTLTDFDWQVKLAMSSDKLSSIQEPLVNVDMDIQQDGQGRVVSLELNKADLQKFIASLDAANKAVQQLKC